VPPRAPAFLLLSSTSGFQAIESSELLVDCEEDRTLRVGVVGAA
jgi:hypothetical protein